MAEGVKNVLAQDVHAQSARLMETIAAYEALDEAVARIEAAASSDGVPKKPAEVADAAAGAVVALAAAPGPVFSLTISDGTPLAPAPQHESIARMCS